MQQSHMLTIDGNGSSVAGWLKSENAHRTPVMTIDQEEDAVNAPTKHQFPISWFQHAILINHHGRSHAPANWRRLIYYFTLALILGYFW